MSSGFNALEFRSRLKDGGARPNLFQVKLNIPDSADASEGASFYVEASSSPSYTIGFAEAYYFGRRVNFGGDREYEPWSVECIADERFDLRRALESWQDRIARGNWGEDHIENSNGLALYSDAEVLAYSKEGDVIRTIKLFNVFPVMIGPLQYSWSNNNQIQRFTADFRFDYAEVINT